MARTSNGAQKVKLEVQDTINMFGMRGTVLAVEVIRPADAAVPVGVLVVADFTHGKGTPTILNLSDIQAVRFDGGWVNFKGEDVDVS
jgi:hypothetical protein